MQIIAAEALVASGFKADGAVIGEPPGNRGAIGDRGLECLEVEFEGKAAHGSTPEAGISAIVAAARFVSLVEKDLVPGFERRRDPVLGPPAVNMGTSKGGQPPT